MLERETEISQQVVGYLSSVMNTQVTLSAFKLSKRLLIALALKPEVQFAGFTDFGYGF